MKNELQKILHCLILMSLCTCMLLATGCSVKKTVSIGEREDLPPAGAFHKAVIHKFEADEKLARRHPRAAMLCENAAFEELLQTGYFTMIVKASSVASVREQATVIVKVRLAYWGDTLHQEGAKKKTVAEAIMAEVRLIDASTGKTFHDEYVAAADSKSCVSNPAELGKLVARHICRTVGKK
jgi:hypothetical protein